MTFRAKAYLIGGGIGSLAAAAFMIRDAEMPGEHITVIDSTAVMGGSLDAAGDPKTGYSMRGGRMLTMDNYECTWDLFKSIPALGEGLKTVFEETFEFNEMYKSNSLARLVDKRRAKIPVRSMGFSIQDRLELLKLSESDEGRLGNSRITDWLSPGFFESEFWCMWATTFAFQPWHSAVEFRRYLHRFVLEFSRIDTLAGVKRTIFNQRDSLVRPLQQWLERQGVQFRFECLVTALDHKTEEGKLIVTKIHTRVRDDDWMIEVSNGDLVFLQSGSMTDFSSVGSMTQPPPRLSKAQGSGWALWEQLAIAAPGFGNPAVFNSCVAQSSWESFTVTLRNPKFFVAMEQFSGNEAGTGGLVTFKDSNWLMSIVLAHQPHFQQQPPEVQVFWGYGLLPDRIGNFVPKAMAQCSGAEILQELCGHLRFDLTTVETANCIPCMMPYITSMFMPRLPADRPLPVPASSKNLAFVSQFVEIPEDVVFTVEYSIRAAQISVYELLHVNREIPPVIRHDKSVRAQLQALVKAFK